MRKVSSIIVGTGFAILVLGFAAKGITAEDPVKVSPKNYKMLLENDQIRVIDISIKKGEQVKMHTHPAKATVDYLLTSGKLRLTLLDGKTVDFVGKGGEVLWDDASLTHSVKNTGDSDIHIVEVELKKFSDDPVRVAPNNYNVLQDNAQVRILEIRIKPGEKVPMHSHPQTFSYNLSDYKRRFTFPDGTINDSEEKAGASFWSEAFASSSENTGTTEAHVLAVEMKKQRPDDPLKVEPEKSKLLFENDQVRAIEWWFKAGEKFEMHSHPEHVIYITKPSKIKFSFPDGKTSEVEMKAGQVIWSDPVTHSAENIGTSEVRGIAFELK